MEYVFYLMILVILISFIAGFTQTLLYPLVSIDQTELPAVVQQELIRLAPKMKVQTIQVQKIRQRFVLKGLIDKQPAQVTVDLNLDGALAIAELSRGGATNSNAFTQLQTIANGEVPPRVADRLHEVIGNAVLKLDEASAFLGMIGDRTAYRVEVIADDYRYRFQTTEQGEILYARKRHLQH